MERIIVTKGNHSIHNVETTTLPHGRGDSSHNNPTNNNSNSNHWNAKIAFPPSYKHWEYVVQIIRFEDNSSLFQDQERPHYMAHSIVIIIIIIANNTNKESLHIVASSRCIVVVVVVVMEIYG